MLPCSLPLKCKIMAEKQDIAMNQFQVVTDVEYIYGEKIKTLILFQKMEYIILLMR